MLPSPLGHSFLPHTPHTLEPQQQTAVNIHHDCQHSLLPTSYMNVSAANLGPSPFGSCTLNTPLCPPILLAKILLRVDRTNLVVPRNLPLKRDKCGTCARAPLKSPMKYFLLPVSLAAAHRTRMVKGSFPIRFHHTLPLSGVLVSLFPCHSGSSPYVASNHVSPLHHAHITRSLSTLYAGILASPEGSGNQVARSSATGHTRNNSSLSVRLVPRLTPR